MLAALRGGRGEAEIARYAGARYLDDEIRRVLARKAGEQAEARAIAEGLLAGMTPPPAAGPGPVVLPPFPAPAEGNAAALAAQEAASAEHMRDALRRVELRVLHHEAVEEAARTARERFAAGLGKSVEEMTKAERRRAAKPVREAVEAAEAAFLARHGIGELPARQARLFAGSVGSGRTRGVLRALARMRRGNVLVFAPTVDMLAT